MLERWLMKDNWDVSSVFANFAFIEKTESLVCFQEQSVFQY